MFLFQYTYISYKNILSKLKITQLYSYTHKCFYFNIHIFHTRIFYFNINLLLTVYILTFSITQCEGLEHCNSTIVIQFQYSNRIPRYTNVLSHLFIILMQEYADPTDSDH